jgi:putative nucleotidyltransferase with HDIG domain
MIAAAFDDRLMGAPVVTGGGGIGAYRFCGPNKSETLDLMEAKYPNWFSPNLIEFRGQRERLPFDQHFFLALAAPRPFIALEGETDTISLPEAVRQSMLGAEPAYALLGSPNRLKTHYSKHGHAFTAEDWTAMMDYFTREYAWDSLRARVTEQRYLDHALAVEQLMRRFAGPDDNAEEWALAGLLHDIDIAQTSKDLDQHGKVGAQILRDLKFSEPVVHAVLAHDDRAGVARESRLDHAVYCADQWYWLQRATERSKRPLEQMKKECSGFGLAITP